MPPILRPLENSPYHRAIPSLIAAARSTRMKSHAPYSRFMVGTAILMADAVTYSLGTNVEAVDYDVTHAEESAISAMCLVYPRQAPVLVVSVGAFVGTAEPDAPIVASCGKCRQKIFEWIRSTDRDIDVVVTDPVSGRLMLCSIRELLPLSFG